MPHDLCLSEVWGRSCVAGLGKALSLDGQHDCEYAGKRTLSGQYRQHEIQQQVLQGQAEGGTPQRGMFGVRGDAPRLGDPGGLGYRSAGTAKPAPPHQDERAEQVLRAGGVRGLRIHDGAAPGAHDEAHLEQLHLPHLQERGG